MSGVIAIIPARGGSKGIPEKNIVKLNRKPLIAYSIEACLQSVTIDKLIVSTDCPNIAKVAKRYGAEVLDRPDYLSTDEASSEGVILHALDIYPNYNIAVMIQCTSPLTTTEDIDNCVRVLIDDHYYNSAHTVCQFDHFLWNRQSWIIPEATRVEGVGHDPSKLRERRQDKKPMYLETGAVYAMRVDSFIETGNRFNNPIQLSVMPKDRCFEIDEPLDLEMAKLLMKRLDKSKST
jgi:N-acylneuraminate cytidylyltransferase